jgi:hypothetical protein
MEIPSFRKVWQKIEHHAGKPFWTVRGELFNYTVKGQVLRNSRTPRNIPKTDFKKAYAVWPVSGPGAIANLQGPSYIWAILKNPRITGSSTNSSRPFGRYEKLWRFLDNASPAQNRILVSFKQVSVIIDGDLPPSAKKHRPWWANDKSHVQAKAWLRAGFSVGKESVDFKSETVCFVRNI